MIVGHVCPEAQEGGPIAALRDGDIVSISLSRKELSVALSETDLKSRLSGWKPRDTGYPRAPSPSSPASARTPPRAA